MFVTSHQKNSYLCHLQTVKTEPSQLECSEINYRIKLNTCHHTQITYVQTTAKCCGNHKLQDTDLLFDLIGYIFIIIKTFLLYTINNN